MSVNEFEKDPNWDLWSNFLDHELGRKPYRFTEADRKLPETEPLKVTRTASKVNLDSAFPSHVLQPSTDYK